MEVRERSDALIANVQAIEDSVANGFELAERGARVREERNGLRAENTVRAAQAARGHASVEVHRKDGREAGLGRRVCRHVA